MSLEASEMPDYLEIISNNTAGKDDLYQEVINSNEMKYVNTDNDDSNNYYGNVDNIPTYGNLTRAPESDELYCNMYTSVV